MFDIYLAAPLFSNAERAWNKRLAEYLREKGFSVFLPQEQCEGIKDLERVFSICKGGLDTSRLVVAVLDGPDADSGTSWECGYAKGTGKAVVGVRTDFRLCEEEEKHVNAVLYFGADKFIEDMSGCDEKLFRKVVEGVRELLVRGEA